MCWLVFVWLIDFEEVWLLFGVCNVCVVDCIYVILLYVFGLCDVLCVVMFDVVVYDLFVIVKGIVDVVGVCGEIDVYVFEVWVWWVVCGYFWELCELKFV